MRIKPAIPLPDRTAKLKPDDFSAVLAAVPDDCVLIGGQAVAWWAERYGIEAIVEGKAQEVTSCDIDFWGTHDDLFQIASSLKRRPALPNRYELTLLIGSIELQAAGKKTVLEVLHAVPGLDTSDPLKAAVQQPLDQSPGARKLLVLSPVSLVLAKLHALRHFSQEDRQDLVHLQVSLRASHAFISEALQQHARLALWNCNRLIDAHHQKAYQRLQQKHAFQILEAVPVDNIRSAMAQAKPPDRERMKKFLEIQWPKISAPDPLGTTLES